MRKLLALFLIVISESVVAFAQPYSSILGDSSTTWHILREIPDGAETEVLYTIVDSSFNNFNYKCVTPGFWDCNFLREDTSSGKAWLYKDTVEYLIMDLNLAVGDTFLLNVRSLGSDSIAIVDSVYYVAGKKHVRTNYMLAVLGEEEQLTFIEGIGTNAGILYQNEDNWNMVFNNYLLCLYRDDTLFHKNALFNENCNVFWIGMEETKNEKAWEMYPNPFNDFTLLSFDNSSTENGTLNIYDVHGRLLRTTKNIKRQVAIARGNLTAGIYFFQFLRNSQVVASGKLLVE